MHGTTVNIFLHLLFLLFSFLLHKLDLNSEGIRGSFWLQMLFIFPILLCKLRCLLVSYVQNCRLYFKICFMVLSLYFINFIVSKIRIIFFIKKIILNVMECYLATSSKLTYIQLTQTIIPTQIKMSLRLIF
jgi:hypothetical protein